MYIGRVKIFSTVDGRGETRPRDEPSGSREAWATVRRVRPRGGVRLEGRSATLEGMSEPGSESVHEAAARRDRYWAEAARQRGVTRTITVYAPGPRASALVQMLREEGVEVEWEPPQEQRGVGDMAVGFVLSLVASGAYDGIKAAVKKFREWLPGVRVEVEGEEDEEPEEDDGEQDES